MSVEPEGIYGELEATLPRGAEGPFLLFCSERGSLGAETPDPEGEEVVVRVWFEGPIAPDPEDWEGAFRRRFPAAALPLRIAVRQVPARDWASEWREGFAALPVGKRLVICPPWAPKPPRPLRRRRVLVIEPAQAFGTGRHLSTELALVLLERALRKHCPDRLADVGAGSGILALAARRLGVRDVCLCDTDPVVLPEIRRNFELSGEPPPDTLVEGGPEVLEGKFPLVVANLDARQLAAAWNGLSGLPRAGGRILVSGLREEETGPLLARWDEDQVFVRDVERRDGWCAFLLEPPGGEICLA